MCGFGGKPILASGFMPQELIEKIIGNRDFLSSLEEIRLNGRGESSLYPDFTQILQRIAGCFPGVRLSLFTNLMFEDETILDNLLKYHVELLISVDSPNKANYEYIRRGANFELLINRLEKLSGAFLVFTLQTSNIDEIRDIGKFANQYHLGLILNIVRTDNEDYRNNFQNLIEVKWDAILNQLSDLHDIIPPKRLLIPDQIWGKRVPDSITTTVSCGSIDVCPNLLSEIMIANNGIVYTCNMFNPQIFGNIYEKDLEKIWISPERLNFVDHYKENYYCKNCEYMILHT